MEMACPQAPSIHNMSGNETSPLGALTTLQLSQKEIGWVAEWEQQEHKAISGETQNEVEKQDS